MLPNVFLIHLSEFLVHIQDRVCKIDKFVQELIFSKEGQSNLRNTSLIP